MKRGTGVVSLLLLAVLVSSCGGGGSSASSPYTGLMTPAVITDNNADDIALAAYQGGDLGANTGFALAPAGAAGTTTVGARPVAVSLVQAATKAALGAFGPSPRVVVTVDNVIDDGIGGQITYHLAVNDQTGTFTGTFRFENFHGDDGVVVNGNAAVSGSVSQDFSFLYIRIDFLSVNVVDAANDVTAIGSVELTIDLNQMSDTGTCTLNLVFRDNVTLKTVWLENVALVNNVGTGFSDVTLSGRIYLHDYGYVDIATVAPFHYLDGATHPSSGQMTVTGDQGKGVRLTADSQTQATVDVDSDADGLYDDLTITISW
jgi:hypothetical protein